MQNKRWGRRLAAECSLADERSSVGSADAAVVAVVVVAAAAAVAAGPSSSTPATEEVESSCQTSV